MCPDCLSLYQLVGELDITGGDPQKIGYYAGMLVLFFFVVVVVPVVCD